MWHLTELPPTCSSGMPLKVDRGPEIKYYIEDQALFLGYVKKVASDLMIGSGFPTLSTGESPLSLNMTEKVIINQLPKSKTHTGCRVKNAWHGHSLSLAHLLQRMSLWPAVRH